MKFLVNRQLLRGFIFLFFVLGNAEAQMWGVRHLLDNTATPTIRLTDKDGKQIDTVSRSSLEMINRVSSRLSATYGFSNPELFSSRKNGPNAFVTLGSSGPLMGVGTDMLRLIGNDEDLLAAVIGHEYGHLKGDHLTVGRANMAVVDLIGMLAGFALDIDQAKKGVDTQGLGMELGNVGAGLVNAKFSRDQEREADAFGIERMARAGYDPSAAARLWTLMEREGVGGDGLWLSSHPSPPERFKTLQAAASRWAYVYLANKPSSQTQLVAQATVNNDLNQINLREAMSAAQRNDYSEAFNIYSTLANQGNSIAQANLGLLYLEGKGMPADDEKAAYWFQKAANQGNAHAQGSLGFMYSNGRGVPKNDAEAVRWYKSAADLGSSYAQGHLGIMYATGRGVAKDESEAVKLFRKAADRGEAMAQANLAYSYETGRGVAKDEMEAFNWYSKSAAQANAFAQNNLGIMYFRGRGVRRDVSEAFKLFKRSADQGFAAGQYSMAMVLDGGFGVTKDESQAFTWALKAAQQNHAGAQNYVGYLYSQGKGAPLNHAEAIFWYRKSAAQGNPVAQANIGKAYRDGLAVVKSDQEALNWHRLSAAQGYANAQKELGDIYRTGRGVAKDENEAAVWYRKAIAGGDLSATNALNDMVGAQKAEQAR